MSLVIFQFSLVRFHKRSSTNHTPCFQLLFFGTKLEAPWNDELRREKQRAKRRAPRGHPVGSDWTPRHEEKPLRGERGRTVTCSNVMAKGIYKIQFVFLVRE